MCNQHLPSPGHSTSPGLARASKPENSTSLWNQVQEIYLERFEAIQTLETLLPEMRKKDQEFGKSLVDQFLTSATLSPKQWEWVETLSSRVTGAESIYGSFDPILVMFRLAQANGGLKKPRIRLLAEDNTFVMLTFHPVDGRSGEIEIHTGGWAGHGHRTFAGWVSAEKLIPYMPGRISDPVKNVIQALALDPLGCAKAMASKLGACMYCGSALTDPPSKEAGYGPVCAENYGLPWGSVTSEDRKAQIEAKAKASAISEMEDLGDLF